MTVKVNKKQSKIAPGAEAKGPTSAIGREAAQFGKDSRQEGKARKSHIKLSRGAWLRLFNSAAHEGVRHAAEVEGGRGEVINTPRRVDNSAINDIPGRVTESSNPKQGPFIQRRTVRMSDGVRMQDSVRSRWVEAAAAQERWAAWYNTLVARNNSTAEGGGAGLVLSTALAGGVDEMYGAKRWSRKI